MDTTIQGKNSTYHIIKPLKSGGMGEVLLARDDMDRRVAIKRPFASALADGLARFKLEAQAATLDHPNIAKIYETGIQSDGRPYLAMEYVDGKELKEIIESGEPLDLLVKLSIIEQVCSGLGYAHQKGFIHRDIKPGNVMVQPNGVAKIIDFGIAKMIDVDRTSDLTQASQVIGSLHYIAPERFKNEAMDGRVDVFSTGVMLYLLLTGKLPFVGGEATAAYQIVNEAPTALGAHIRDYPPALDGIVDQALAKNPDQRFATAEDFGDALHEVIEDVKKSRISSLFDDAERLTMETRYDPALELLDEAIKLDPANTQVRKLRKLVRDKQVQQKNEMRLRDYIARAEEFLAVENYPDALAQLKEGYRVVPASRELKDRIALVEAQKQRYDRSVAALAEAEAAKNRGDITGAFRISDNAVRQDPDNTRLLALRAAIASQLEREAQQARVAAILETARGELSAKNFPRVEQLLLEAEAIDRSHPRIEELRREMVQTREREKRLQLLEEVRRHVNDLLRADDYERATELLTRAIDQLPGEDMLHRLKMEVDTAARKFDSIRFVDRALASAQQTFPSDPQRSLAILREALQQLPGDERLIACELSLRQQADVLQTKQLLSQALRSAREFFTAEQFDKAIDVLETYQLEHGNQADIDDLLSYSRRELAAQQRRMLVDRTVAEARSLIGHERLEDAVRLLESTLQSPAIHESGDRTLSVLLDDVREKQSAAARKQEAIVKRAAMHRERGELDEGIQVLSEYMATGVRNPAAEDLLSSLQTDRTRKHVTIKAIEGAEQATQQADFTVALDSLQAVVQAYGDSEELARATQQVEQARSAHAQQVVGKSIETSRAALLANDVTGAVAALRAAGEMVEFADPAKQADWKRIGQAVATAQSKTGTRKTKIVDPLAELPEQAPSRKPLMLALGILAACVVIIVVGFLVFHKLPPPPSKDAYISVAKAPPGARVSIDGLPKGITDASGSLSLPVDPGPHELEVAMEGYDSFTDNPHLRAGETFVENIALTKHPPASSSGTLLIQGNLPVFKISVDGHPLGLKKQGPLTLDAGQRSIQYSNEDGTDIGPKHIVPIVAGSSMPDTFTLKPPIEAPKVADDAAARKAADDAARKAADDANRKAAADDAARKSADDAAARKSADDAAARKSADDAAARKSADDAAARKSVDDAAARKAADDAAARKSVDDAAARKAAQKATDIQEIQTAVSNFQANPTTAKSFADAVKSGGKLLTFVAKCEDQPAISADGNTATQRCYETSKWDGMNQTTNPFTYTFVKTGSKWVLKDRKSLK
jgi:serine/threonine-protein kinase